MKILKPTLIIAVTAAALALTPVSCDDAAIVPDDGSKMELRLSSSVHAVTRADFTETDTQIADGEDVLVYVDETGLGTLYEKITLTADGNGGLSGNTKMFFPESRKSADIYVLHTNAVWPGAAYPATAITHTVAADQQTLAGYAASDLLYSRSANVARTSAVVGLTFYHLLSKVEVAVMPGNGLTASYITGITIGGTKRDAAFTPDKATAPSAIPITASGLASAIAISSDVSANLSNPTYNAAVVVPQTLVAGTEFITVHLTTGYLVYRLPAETTFESGKKYVYKITANLAELVVTSSIVDWSPADPVTGSATLE